MILKITKWVLILIAILVIGLVTLLETGSRLSVDRDYSHSQNTEALPEFSSQTPSGLVRVRFYCVLVGYTKYRGDETHKSW